MILIPDQKIDNLSPEFTYFDFRNALLAAGFTQDWYKRNDALAQIRLAFKKYCKEAKITAFAPYPTAKSFVKRMVTIHKQKLTEIRQVIWE